MQVFIHDYRMDGSDYVVSFRTVTSSGKEFVTEHMISSEQAKSKLQKEIIELAWIAVKETVEIHVERVDQSGETQPVECDLIGQELIEPKSKPARLEVTGPHHIEKSETVQTVTYSAILYDQYEKEVPNKKIKFELEAAPDNVSIKENILTVQPATLEEDVPFHLIASSGVIKERISVILLAYEPKAIEQRVQVLENQTEKIRQQSLVTMGAVTDIYEQIQNANDPT
ncbi:hypothetical protein [Brevibacillus laterosporus]|uniref:hypothetical protein n=1 Tax=Brevibacillus laterosporus TaxID=1465 RepID=UPI0018F8A45B|nr:hypothetical protein [Brevibacillus laterosporus]MBG9773578.1 hypothetical protein [Brevibacillus laterosporus]